MSEKKIIWVLGGKGNIGSEIANYAETQGYDVAVTDSELSVTDATRVEAFATELRPHAIINCAAIRRDATKISTRIKAYETNALGARNVAIAANAVDATVVQISSDDVYNTRLDEPVNEFDNPHPNTPYGKSKRAGEMQVRDITQKHIIVRSSWLYNTNGGMLADALRAAKAGEKYEARMDQFACPTSINLYMKYLFRIIESGKFGTFHIAAEGKTSRFDFLTYALKLTGYNPGDILIPKTEMRSAESIILDSLILEMFGAEMPTWEEDLKNYLEFKGLLKNN